MSNEHRIQLTVISLLSLCAAILLSACTTTADSTEEDPGLYENMETYGEIDDGSNDSYPWLSSRETSSDLSAERKAAPRKSAKKRVVRK